VPKPSALSAKYRLRLAFFIDSYRMIADWCSVVERLSGFERALERVRIQAATSRASARRRRRHAPDN